MRGNIPVELTIIPHNLINFPQSDKPKPKGDLIFCKKCDDYHWQNEEHKESWLESTI